MMSIDLVQQFSMVFVGILFTNLFLDLFPDVSADAS